MDPTTATKMGMTSSDDDDPTGLAPARGVLNAFALTFLVILAGLAAFWGFDALAADRPWRAIHVAGTGFVQVIEPDGTPMQPGRYSVVLSPRSCCTALVYVKGRSEPVWAVLETVGGSDGGFSVRAVPGFDGSTRITILP